MTLTPPSSKSGSPARRDPHGMSRKEKHALVILEEAARRFGSSLGYGVLTSSATALIDGQAWIHWRTARALERRGFVRIEGYGEEAEVLWA